ncbi:MAG: DNA-binding response regulator, partial [Candidatus Dormibacteria bacterium]
MSPDTSLASGRQAFQERRWSEAFTELSAAERDKALAPAEYEMLAVTEFLLSSDAGGVDTWERAHHELLARGDIERAVRCAFWLAMNLLDRGEMARGAGWIERGRRLLNEANLDCGARGYLLIPSAIQAAAAGDIVTAMDIADEALRIGQRFGDDDLGACGSNARQGRGRVGDQGQQRAQVGV